MKMNKLASLCVAGSLLTASSLAMAWESEDGQNSVTASVALTSDYVWRGYSQTDENAAIQGSFDYGHSSGFYAGAWGSNVDFDSDDFDFDTSMELDIYAGWGTEVNGWAFDLGALRYIYPDQGNFNFWELYGSVGYSIVTASVAYSDDVYGTDENGTYYNLALDYEIGGDTAASGIALSAGIGYYDYSSKVFGPDNPDSVVDYHVGISKEFFDIGFDISYYDTDSDGQDLYGKLGDDRWVFTVSKSM